MELNRKKKGLAERVMEERDQERVMEYDPSI